MSTITAGIRNVIPLTRIMLSNPQMIKVDPSLLRFFSSYMNKFQVQKVGKNLILHSHLPPLNSRAYSRFVTQHLLERTSGPTHAQIGVTNACPQHCEYCYNKNRRGQVMDQETILRTVKELKNMGIVWLGLTGGEPLLSKNLLEIVESVADDCAVKIFTTGCTLTPAMASDLKRAGVFSVSVSLDHWIEEKHDQGRHYPGAYQAALKAIDILKNTDGLHVSVSAVLSREMINNGQTEEFLHFLNGLGVNEAWLSEVKPSVTGFQQSHLVITEEERQKLIKLQDEYNQRGEMTVNYLGHFEDKACFGCNAGHKMVYIDAFGEVSPCVFTPMSFGNVREESIASLFSNMQRHFPSEQSCFINKNYRLLQKYSRGQNMLSPQDTLKMMDEVRFGPLSKFFQLYYGAQGSQEKMCLSGIGREVRESI
jgi:MoaA/NifB/PqqE/SkfB family radical SAM enzyme